MAANPQRYYINNQPLSIKNVLQYMFCLNYNGIIPDFTVSIDNNELCINTIYSATSTRIPVNGYTTIIYNIYTKKWRGIINLASIIDGRLVDKTFANIYRDFPFVIENNLLKINYEFPYIEYVIESDYIEDILEPSLNVFNILDHASINPYNIFPTPQNINRMHYHLATNSMFYSLLNFYNKIDLHEKYLLFQSIKPIINEIYHLPEELLENIYYYFIN